MQIYLLRAALLLAAATAPLLASGQEYPARPIRFIVGFVPGGIADLLARSLGQKLTEAFASYVKAELARWMRVLKEIGIGDAP